MDIYGADSFDKLPGMAREYINDLQSRPEYGIAIGNGKARIQFKKPVSLLTPFMVAHKVWFSFQANSSQAAKYKTP